MFLEPRPIDIERLAGGSSVAVPRIWLESDERMRRVVERVDSSRNKRRVAQAIQPFCTDPPAGTYDEICIVIHPHGQGEEMTVTFEGLAHDPVGSDRIKFMLRADSRRPGYVLESKEKLVEPAWSGGCVSRELRRELLRLLPAEKVVWEVSERFSRAVDDSEMGWDWHPRWNFERVSTPDVKRRLDSFFEGRDCPFAVLGSWSFTTEDKDWTSSGVRVRVVFDPLVPQVVAAWSEDWQMLL